MKYFTFKRVQAFIITGLLITSSLSSQEIRFGIFADPVIGWFSSDTRETANDGARPGFNFGITFNRYFAKNYSFSSGISILNAGGRLISSDTLTMYFNNFNTLIPSGKPVVYKIQYINVPLGLKFESNQIGYVTFFTDVGLDPKVVIGGKVDIPSVALKGETAMKELNRLNLGYHITAGISYSLGGTTEIVAGLGFEQCFMDITKDLLQQPQDKISHNFLKFRVGLNF